MQPRSIAFRVERGKIKPLRKRGKSASWSAGHDADADETAANIANARKIVSVHLNNTHSAVVWLQVFDAVSPTVGTTTPALTIPLAPGANNIVIPDGVQVSAATGIAIAVTAGATNNTAPGATVLGSVTYR